MTGDHEVRRVVQNTADDYDLLTYGEAAARLTEEIREERRHLAYLGKQARSADPIVELNDDLGAAITAVRKRIGDLSEAAERQARQQRDARDFVRFFGYDPRQDDHD